MKTCKKGLHQYPDEWSQCKECNKIADTIRKQKYPEKHKLQQQRSRKKYKLSHLEQERIMNKANREAKPEQYKEAQKRCKKAKPEQYKQYYRQYFQTLKMQDPISYQARTNAKHAKRRAIKLHATPKWLSTTELSMIEKLYTICSWLNGWKLVKFHVDHIIPLQHKDICGLHILSNLQILSQHDNNVKSNSFDYTHNNELWKAL